MLPASILLLQPASWYNGWSCKKKKMPRSSYTHLLECALLLASPICCNEAASPPRTVAFVRLGNFRHTLKLEDSRAGPQVTLAALACAATGMDDGRLLASRAINNMHLNTSI